MTKKKTTPVASAKDDETDLPAPDAGVIDTRDGVDQAEASLAGAALAEYDPETALPGGASPEGTPLDSAEYGIWNTDGLLWFALQDGSVFHTPIFAVANAQLHNIEVNTGVPDRYAVRRLE